VDIFASSADVNKSLKRAQHLHGRTGVGRHYYNLIQILLVYIILVKFSN
jgi:hypothetical protein